MYDSSNMVRNSVTELLDVAPIDFFAGLSKQFLEAFPPGTFSDEQRAQALDVEFHWVTEKGNPAKLTGGVTVQATVRIIPISQRHSTCF